MTHASEGPPLDPRVPAQIEALLDDEVTAVLRLMHAEWASDFTTDPPFEPASTPAANRAWLIETVRLNMGNGGEAEYTLFLDFIARAKAADTALTQDGESL
jgi:hypothetical protein